MSTSTAKTKSTQKYLQNIKSAPAFSKLDKIGYMLGDLGFNSLQVLVNTYLMLFCVNIMGMSAIHFSIIVFVCKALDALNDTFIGRIVDLRPGNKGGKFKPWILWFAIPYVIFTIVLFLNVEAMPYTAKIIWVLIIYFIWGIVGTFINVPYGTLSNVVTANQMERTELSNARSIGSLVANFGTATLAPMLLYDANNNPIASRFLVLSVILGIFCIVCLFFTYKLCHERIAVTNDAGSTTEKVHYWKVMKTFVKNRPMIAIVLAYIISKFFIQTTSLTNQYVFMVYFKDTSILSLSAITGIIPLVLGMLTLKPLIKKFGKKNLITWPVLLSALIYAINMILPISAYGWIIVQMVSSFFTGYFSLLIWSLIADAVDYQTYLTGEHNEGTVYATITFLVFFISSMSTSLIALLLEFVGYDATLGSNQAAGVVEGVKILSGALPVVGCILIFICFKLIYNMTDDEMRKISDVVKQRSDEIEATVEIEK